MTIIDKEIVRAAIPIEQYYHEHLGQPAKTSGKHRTYFCKFHEDKKTPNLTVYFDGGYRCEACGENGGDVFAFYMKLTGHSFPDALKYFAGRYAPSLLKENGNEVSKEAVLQHTIEDARKAVGENWLVKKKKGSGYVPTGLYEYRCHESGLKCWRIRMDHPDSEINKKWISPFSIIDGNWELKEPPFPCMKPIYIQKPEEGGRVFYIFEGERMVDAAAKLGFNAATSGSSSSAENANWEELRGHEVIIWPDKDEPGLKYAGVVAEKLQLIGCQVQRVDIEKLNLPAGGDICDWLTSNPEAGKKEVEALLIIEPVNEKAKIIPFPVPANGTGLNDYMKTAGILALSENSGPDEIIEAINKFSATTENKDMVFLGIARSEIIKKLKNIGVQSPTKVVGDSLKPQKSKAEEGQGQTLSFEDPEPWLNEVDGLNLLDEISETIRRYVILPKGAETALSLWVLFAWTHDAFQISPLLDFRSPLKRCGKSTGLKVVKRLVPKPLAATNVSTPSLFRGIEAFNPTLLIDEVDTFLNRDQETNGILNGGHERDGAFVLRCEGDNHEPRLFSVWCPKVLSGIGRRKDTLEDRSIPIRMKRKAPGQKVEKLPINSGGEFLTLRQKMARWSEDHLEELRGANPDIPETLNDRAQDNWWPLFAIADLCGKKWSEKTREVAVILSGDDNQDDDTWGVQLLSDIREYFKEQSTDRVSSEDLVQHLLTLEDRDWSEMGRSGKEITKRGVSRILKPFDVKPKTIRPNNGTTAKGYTEEMFEDAFFHYLPDTSVLNVTSVTSLNNKELGGFQNVTNPQNVTDVKQPNLFKNNNVTNVTDKNGGMEVKKTNEVPSYKNGWQKKHFDDEYGNPQAVWEKDGLEVPV